MTGRTIIPTANGFGWTSEIPNPITVRFLEFIAQQEVVSPAVIDIGVGLGVATLPALRAGAFVIANDISEEHLYLVGARASTEGFHDRIRLLKAKLPNLPKIEPVDAVHCSNVLHFLSTEEILLAANWMFRFVRPDGHIFIQTISPFAGHFRDFLPVYNYRKRNCVEFAGEMTNAKSFVLPTLREMIPIFINVMESEFLASIFSKVGFKIIYCDYYSRAGLPEPCRLDGRENLGLVAFRPR